MKKKIVLSLVCIILFVLIPLIMVSANQQGGNNNGGDNNHGGNNGDNNHGDDDNNHGDNNHHENDNNKVNGGWSDWSPKNESCGFSGEQTRTCTNPTPSHNGNDCHLLNGGNSTREYTNPACTPTTGKIEITKYVCPADTTVIRSANGVGKTVPNGCTLQGGATFGYVHGTQTDAGPDYPELDTTPTIAGTTNANGNLTLNDLSATGRYLIVETDSSGNKLQTSDILGLYCVGDGDTSDNNDNQELTFVKNGETSHCVAYNKAPIVPSEPITGCMESTASNYNPQATVASECIFPNTIVDLCPNINDIQTTIPEGMKLNSDNQCVKIEENHNSRGGSVPHGNIGGQGRVLGASTSCSPYLNTFIKYGNKDNDKDEVKKLQEFINGELNLTLVADGIYGKSTFNAVKKFQEKYGDDVLLPWVKIGTLKETKGTGYVYKTTQRKINLLKCPELELPMPSLN